MTRDDDVLAALRRLEADNRTMKRTGAAVLTVLLVFLCGAAFRQQGQEPKKDESAIRDVLRTRRLELANARGAVIAVLQPVEEQEEPGWLTDFHDNGRRKWRAQVANNRYEGQFTAWWPNGLKSEEGTYVKGKKHGLFTTYHDNGQQKAVGAYADGVMVGIWTLWHDNGQKKAEGLFEDDKKIDVWKEWHGNGKLASTRSYKNGVLDGPQQLWHPNGQQNEVYACSGGVKVGEYRAFFANGKPAMEGSFDAGGKQTGEWKIWKEDGSVDPKTGTYDQGKRVTPK